MSETLTAEQKKLEEELFQFYSTYSRYYIGNYYYQLNKVIHHDPRTAYLLQQIRPEDDVLEVGSASGIMTLLAARLARTATGVDLSALGCRFAREIRDLEVRRGTLIEQHAGMAINSQAMAATRFVAGSAEHLPFPDASFSLIFCRETLEHVARPYVALREMVRCLRPGGSLVLEIPIPEIDVDLDQDAWKDHHGLMGDKDAISRVEVRPFKQWVEESGLSTVSFNVIYGMLGLKRLARWFPFLEGGLLKRWEVMIWTHLRKDP